MGIRIALTGARTHARHACSCFGVKRRSRRTPAAARLEALLDAQHYTRGLALRRARHADQQHGRGGTRASAAATQRRLRGRGRAAADRRPAPTARSCARLLGRQAASCSPDVEGAARTEDLDARQLQTALWPVTGGYYLDQILRRPSSRSRARRAARRRASASSSTSSARWARSPTLRVGRQPYGLLPAMSLELLRRRQGRFVRTPALPARGLAQRARPACRGCSPTSTTRRRSSRSCACSRRRSGYRRGSRSTRQSSRPAAVLPGAARRRICAPRARSCARPADGASRQRAASTERRLRRAAGDARARLLERRRSVSSLHLVRCATRRRLRRALLGAAAEPDALLHLLLRHSVLLAQATSRAILVRKGCSGPSRTASPCWSTSSAGPRRRRPRRCCACSTATRRCGRRSTRAPELEELRAALQFLETRARRRRLARHLAGCLDLFAYRLDAWITSLATRRLDELRKADAARPRARRLRLGPGPQARAAGAGPRLPAGRGRGRSSPPREPGGAIHAPSMPQASAAAVLRSGYLAQRGRARPLAVDLRSERVRLARVAARRRPPGPAAVRAARLPLRARACTSAGSTASSLGFRRISRLPELSRGAGAAGVRAAMGGDRPVQLHHGGRGAAIAARARRDARTRLGAPADGDGRGPGAGRVQRASPTGSRWCGCSAAGGVPFDAARRRRSARPAGAARRRSWPRSTQAVDALGDALTAEGVYQAVRGNPARAAASVDALAHGEIQPPELAVRPDAARRARRVTHRLVTLFCSTPAPGAADRRARRAGARRAGARAVAARRWSATCASVRLARRVRRRGRQGAAARATKLPLGALVPSPLDALYLSHAPTASTSSGCSSTRCARARRRRSRPTRRCGCCRTGPPRCAATQLSLAEFLELNARVPRGRAGRAGARRPRLRACRAAESRPAVDAAELQARRADVAVADAAARRARGAERRPTTCASGSSTSSSSASRTPSRLGATAPTQRAGALLGRGRPAPGGGRRDDARPRGGRARGAGARSTRSGCEAVFGAAFRALPLVRPANLAELGELVAALGRAAGRRPAAGALVAAGREPRAPGRLAAGGRAVLRGGARARAGARSSRSRSCRSPPASAGSGSPARDAADARQGLARRAPAAAVPGRRSRSSGLLLDEWVEVVPDARGDDRRGVQLRRAGGARRRRPSCSRSRRPGTARWEVETLEATLLETLELAQAARGRPAGARAATRCCSARCRRCT